MHKGTIVELGDRESGFIREIGVKENMFFHSDALLDVNFKNLKKGDKVEFEVTESKKGPYATRIKKV